MGLRQRRTPYHLPSLTYCSSPPYRSRGRPSVVPPFVSHLGSTDVSAVSFAVQCCCSASQRAQGAHAAPEEPTPCVGTEGLSCPWIYTSTAPSYWSLQMLWFGQAQGCHANQWTSERERPRDPFRLTDSILACHEALPASSNCSPPDVGKT